MQKGFKDVNLQGCVSGRFAVPVIGENGNWFIGNDDTGVSATGKGGGSNGGGDGVHYSTEEQVIGTWIDGSALYRKVIKFGALPNNAAKEVDHNITNINQVIKCEAMAYIESKYPLPLPYVNPSSITSGPIYVRPTETTVLITTNVNRSNYNSCYVILEYTKTIQE